MAIRLTNHLLASVLVCWSPVISDPQNRTDSALAVGYGKACNKSEQCRLLGPEFWCHPEHRNCSCKGALLWFVSLHRCTQAVALKEECEASEQCIAYDRHSYCGEFGRSQLPPKICQCQFGFNMKDLHNQARCIEMAKYDCDNLFPEKRPVHEVSSQPGQARKNSLYSCSGLQASTTVTHAFGTPLFDSRDTVPIVMGCLAAGLALVACCAGIVQLLRIKHRSLPFRTGGSEEPHGSVVLSLGPDMIPFHVPTCNGTSPDYSSGFYRASTAIVEDLPPSYEEAVKDSAQILPPPSYVEHKPDD